MKISDSIRDYITSCMQGRAARAAPSSPRISYSITNRISTAFQSFRSKLFHSRPPAGRYDDEPRQSWSLPAGVFDSPRSLTQGSHALAPDALENPAIAKDSPSPPAIQHSGNSANLQIKSQKISREPIPENVQKLMKALETGDLAALSTIEDLASIVNTPLRCRTSCAVLGERLVLKTPSALELAVYYLKSDQSENAANVTRDSASGRMEIVKALAKAGASVLHPDSWGLLIKKARIALMEGEARGFTEAVKNKDRFLNHISAMCVFAPIEQMKSAYAVSSRHWHEETVKGLIDQFEQIKNDENADPERLDKLSFIYVCLFQQHSALEKEKQSISGKKPLDLAHYYAIKNAAKNNDAHSSKIKSCIQEIYSIFSAASHHLGAIDECKSRDPCMHIGMRVGPPAS